MTSIYIIILVPLLILRRYYKDDLNLDKFKNLRSFVYICFGYSQSNEQLIEKLGNFETYSSDAHCNDERLFTFVHFIKSTFGFDVDKSQRSFRQHYSALLFCSIGLQCSYLLWGVLQERIMTKNYSGDRFTDSQFLVFSNRLMSLLIVIPLHYFPLTTTINPLLPYQQAPFFDFSFASLSNIFSSWFQYEALKFISFPTQTLLKASKVLPVMVMGKFVQKRTYKKHEYLTALMISVGMTLFLLSNRVHLDSKIDSKNVHLFSSTLGVLLVIGYVLTDSFTSNWQDYLFTTHKLSSLQVMIGVNLWSTFFTFISLIANGTLLPSLTFIVHHPLFACDVFLSSNSSAFGQLFIFLTISQFGAATFVLIMTLRLGFSIMLSCFLFGHKLSHWAIVGIAIIFAALAIRIYARKQKSMKASMLKNGSIV